MVPTHNGILRINTIEQRIEYFLCWTTFTRKELTITLFNLSVEVLF